MNNMDPRQQTKFSRRCFLISFYQSCQVKHFIIQSIFSPKQILKHCNCGKCVSETYYLSEWWPNYPKIKIKQESTCISQQNLKDLNCPSILRPLNKTIEQCRHVCILTVIKHFHQHESHTFKIRNTLCTQSY